MEDIGNPYNIFGAGDRDTPAYLIRRYLYRIFNIVNCAHCIAKLFLSPFLPSFFFLSFWTSNKLWSYSTRSFDHLCNNMCLTINIIFNIYHSPFHDYQIRNAYFWIFWYSIIFSLSAYNYLRFLVDIIQAFYMFKSNNKVSL